MINDLTKRKRIRTFSLSPENLTGEKGKGGMATEGTASNAARDLGQGWKVNPFINVEAEETAILADVQGEGAVKHIWITDNARPRDLILRMYFDGHKTVEAPLSDFFCTADNKEFRQLSSLLVCFNPGKAMNCYFEMPYRKSLRIEVENRGVEKCFIYYQIDCEEKEISPDTLYFHAQFHHVDPLPYMEVHTLLDDVKGAGHYIGTYMHWGVHNNSWWGEGEIKFYIDGDTDFPSICGTGTEDYFLGAYNFDVGGKYTEYTTPYAGLSKVGATDGTYRSQRFFDMYRWHICDPIYFEKDLRVTIQALGWRSESRYRPLKDTISSVAYYYSDTFNEAPAVPSRDDIELA